MRTKCITLYYEITCKFKKQIREIKKKKKKKTSGSHGKGVGNSFMMKN